MRQIRSNLDRSAVTAQRDRAPRFVALKPYAGPVRWEPPFLPSSTLIDALDNNMRTGNRDPFIGGSLRIAQSERDIDRKDIKSQKSRNRPSTRAQMLCTVPSKDSSSR